MKVKVVLTDVYREAVGGREVTEELPEGSSVKDLIDKLASRYGEVFRSIADPDHEDWVSRDVIVLVNATIVHRLSHKLNDGDKVTIADLLEVSLGGG